MIKDEQVMKLIECLNSLVALPKELVEKYTFPTDVTKISTNPAHNWLSVQPDNNGDDEFTTLYDEIISLADSVLITSEGTPAYLTHDVLVKAGYRVVRGEYDSFGWLSGVIITPVGKIVYG